MIFADKVIHHRKKNGWTQEELAEKMDVSRQSISKWEGAQSVPDLEKILKLSNLFGVSTDYLLRDEMEPEESAPHATLDVPEDRADLRTVTLQEATRYLASRGKAAKMIALGVFLCILGLIFLIGMGGAAEFGIFDMSVINGGVLGLIGAVVFAAIGVGLFVITGLRGNEFDYLGDEPFETAYGVDGMVKERREEYRDSYNRWTVIGVIILIFALVPLFLGGLFGEQESVQLGLFLVTLLLGAIGTYIMIRINVTWEGFKKLLQTGDYSLTAKKDKKAAGVISGFYWPLVTAVYLLWSSVSNSWVFPGSSGRSRPSFTPSSWSRKRRSATSTKPLNRQIEN